MPTWEFGFDWYDGIGFREFFVGFYLCFLG